MGHLKRISCPSTVRKCLIALATCGLVLSSHNVNAGIARPSQVVDLPLSKQVSSSAPSAVLPNGTYLFGQAETLDQIGAGYAVFSVKDNQVVGAVYQPRSSFDCFSGQISPSELSMNIVDSYSQTTYPYEIAVTLDNSLVAGHAAGAYTLDGFYQFDELSSADREMLATCKADLSE